MRGLARALAGAVLALTSLVAPAAAGAQTAPPVTEPVTTTVPPTLPDGSPDLQSRSWVVVDAATGAVLAGYDIHAPHLTASTVKSVTALTALRLLGPDGVVQVSADAAARPPRKITMLEGQQWPVRDALWCLMLVSANDAAYALAETAGGTLGNFAVEMAETGRRLGLRESTFADPAGFDHPADTLVGPNTMSAYDLAVVGRAVLADPVLAPMAASTDYAFTGPDGVPHTLTNHNRLLDWYPGVVGVKTGFTNAAQGTFVAAAERNGRRLIGVVMGAPTGIYDPMIRLLDHGFTLAPAAGAEVLPPPVDPAAVVSPTTAAPTTLPPTTVAPMTSAPATRAATTAPPPTAAAPTTVAAGGAAAPLPAAEDGFPVLAGAAGVAVVGAVLIGAASRRAAHRRARRARVLRTHPL